MLLLYRECEINTYTKNSYPTTMSEGGSNENAINHKRETAWLQNNDTKYYISRLDTFIRYFIIFIGLLANYVISLDLEEPSGVQPVTFNFNTFIIIFNFLMATIFLIYNIEIMRLSVKERILIIQILFWGVAWMFGSIVILLLEIAFPNVNDFVYWGGFFGFLILSSFLITGFNQLIIETMKSFGINSLNSDIPKSLLELNDFKAYFTYFAKNLEFDNPRVIFVGMIFSLLVLFMFWKEYDAIY